MKYLLGLYPRFSTIASYVQSPFLLAVRLYWGWQFVQTGWGKMHHIAKVTGFFTSLDILGSRLIGLLLAGNMMVAY
jgi:putative oxidoreductase